MTHKQSVKVCSHIGDGIYHSNSGVDMLRPPQEEFRCEWWWCETARCEGSLGIFKTTVSTRGPVCLWLFADFVKQLPPPIILLCFTSLSPAEFFYKKKNARELRRNQQSKDLIGLWNAIPSPASSSTKQNPNFMAHQDQVISPISARPVNWVAVPDDATEPKLLLNPNAPG